MNKEQLEELLKIIPIELFHDLKKNRVILNMKRKFLTQNKKVVILTTDEKMNNKQYSSKKSHKIFFTNYDSLYLYVLNFVKLELMDGEWRKENE